jgi:hypothetical protein
MGGSDLNIVNTVNSYPTGRYDPDQRSREIRGKGTVLDRIMSLQGELIELQAQLCANEDQIRAILRRVVGEGKEELAPESPVSEVDPSEPCLGQAIGEAEKILSILRGTAVRQAKTLAQLRSEL